jgi:hypothetical protein
LFKVGREQKPGYKKDEEKKENSRNRGIRKMRRRRRIAETGV